MSECLRRYYPFNMETSEIAYGSAVKMFGGMSMHFPHHSIYAAKTKSSRRFCLNLQNFCWLWHSLGFLRALAHFVAFPALASRWLGMVLLNKIEWTNCFQSHPFVGGLSISSHNVSKWPGEIAQIQLFGRNNFTVTSSVLCLVRLQYVVARTA